MRRQQIGRQASLNARVAVAGRVALAAGAAIAPALSVLACTGDRGQHSLSTERDSAGVAIVESTGPAWERGDGWTIGSEPIVDIGVVEGPLEYQLHRATSAVRLSDGRLAVVNGGTNELRLYDSEGRHQYSLGRTGDGPGEFRDLQRVWRLPGDSLLAYDFQPSRFSVFTSGGEFVRSMHAASPDGRQIIVRGPLNDGSLIAMGAPIWSAPGATAGIVRDSVPYYLYDADGNYASTLGVFPSAEVFRFITEDGWRLTSTAFPRNPVAAVADNRFYFGPADSYEIREYSPAGELRRIIRLPHESRPVTPDDLSHWKEQRLEMAEREGTRPAMERRLNELPYPEFMPPYEQILVGGEGNLWIADYRPDRSADAAWKVFDPAGRFLGSLEMPSGFDLFHVGADFLLGRWLDELGVEHIRGYELAR
jgi:hypothetical protein